MTKSSSVRWPFVAVALITIAGGALRFQGLANRDFWFDESCTFLYVQNLFDWPADSNLLVESTNLPYYVAVKGWTALFGQSEAAYRSFSALAATLTVPLLAFAAYRLGRAAAAVVCALLVAFHPLHIHYAHEARAYALWVLGLTLALLLLHEAAQRRSWRWWAGYGAVILGCLYLHYFTIYWLPASVFAVALTADQRGWLRRWLVTTAVVVLLFAPYFLLAVWPAARQGGGAWIAPHWDPLGAIPRTIWAFMPAGGYPAHLRGLSLLSTDTIILGPQWLTAFTRTIPAVVVVLVFFRFVRRKAHTGDAVEQSRSTRTHIFLAGLTFGPLLLAWLYSVLIRPNYLVGRYDLVAWPGFIIWLSVAIGSIATIRSRQRAWMIATICTVLVGCSLLPIARMAALRPPPTFHNLRAQRLAELTTADDLVVAFSYDKDYLAYYLYRAGFDARIVSFPSWLDRQVGWVDTDADLAPGHAERLKRDAAERVAEVEATKAGGGRVFLLVDSLATATDHPRYAIAEYLLRALRNAGFTTSVVNDDLLILEVVRAND